MKSGDGYGRKVGDPKARRCTLCGNRREAVGSLVLCLRCDAPAVKTIRATA